MYRNFPKTCWQSATLAAVTVAALLLPGNPVQCFGQAPSPTVEFSSPIYFGDEDSGSVTITVARSGNIASVVTVDYATGSGLATAGIDYTSQSGTLSFGRGETSKTFSIPFSDDSVPEGSETIPLALTNPTSGAVLGAQATARLYIQDNENRGSLLDKTFKEGAIQRNDFARALVVQSDGKVLAAGNFARAGSPDPDRVIRLNQDGSRDASFATVDGGPNNNVYSIALQPDGKIIIAGEFTLVGSRTSRAGIARLNSDGSLDTSFDPGSGVTGSVSPGVYSVALQKDNKILIGGNFDSVNGVVRNTLARLNPNGSLDISFNTGAGVSSANPNFRVPWISTVVPQTDGKVLIGGQFTDVDGFGRVNVARLNSDGSLDTNFNPGTGAVGNFASVETMALQSDGKAIIGGDFVKVNDIDRNAIARLNTDGSLDSSFDPAGGVTDEARDGSPIVGFVTGLAVQNDGKILLGGAFLKVDEINRHGIARLNRDGTLDGTFGPYLGTTYRNELGYEELETVSAMALQPDGRVLISGTFISVDSSRTNRLTRLLSTNARTSSFEFSVPSKSVGETNGLASFTVIRLGDSADAFTLDYATTDGTATSGTDYTPQSGTLRFGPLEVEKTITIPIFDDGNVENNETVNVTLRNLSSGATFGSPTNLVLHLIDSKKPGNLDFRFAEVDIPFLPDPTAFFPVTKIIMQKDGKALVAGYFAFVNQIPRAGIVRLNTDGSIDSTFVPEPPAGAQIVEFQQMDLQPNGSIIGGFNGVARLNPDGSLDTQFAPDVGNLKALAVLANGKFLVADEFDQGGGFAINEVARFEANGAFDGSFSPADLNDWANVLSVQPDGKVVVGGFFTRVNGLPQNLITRLNTDGSLDTSFNIGAGIQGTTNSAVYSFGLQPDGKLIVGGEFSRVNNVGRTNLARLNPNGSLDTNFNRGIGPNGFVQSVALQPDGKILIGGGFTLVEGVRRVGLARLNSDGSLDTGFEPILTFRDGIALTAIAVQADGSIIIGGLFTEVNGVARSGVARLNGGNFDASIVIKLDAISRNPAGPFTMNVTVPPGKPYRIDASTDLANWMPISTNAAPSSSFRFDDPAASGINARFYRAVLIGP
jgi:uncharacterized delta-60 repeat protein